ncbi:MAG: hypothetical protein FH756_05540 [Firmicutes bacterium]|nr:hypothetical protein [Bacillota bacterium]
MAPELPAESPVRASRSGRVNTVIMFGVSGKFLVLTEGISIRKYQIGWYRGGKPSPLARGEGFFSEGT